MKYLIICLFLCSSAYAAKPDVSTDPFGFRVLIVHNGQNVGMTISYTKSDSVQMAIHDHFNEYTPHFRPNGDTWWQAGDSLKFYIDSPMYGDRKYPPYWKYSCVITANQMSVITNTPQACNI
jgi:hypothetical protein